MHLRSGERCYRYRRWAGWNARGGGGPRRGSIDHPVRCAVLFGRKFLIAGRGGLNLTHSEPVENFPDRYGAEQERWRDLLEKFGSADLEQWANSLGVETYVGSSGRVFPRGQKAAGLLRAWLERLRSNGVEFQTGARFTGLERLEDGWRVRFENGERTAKAVVLALGGASYPETGSDGKWPAILENLGIEIAPWQPANCGWEVNWSTSLLERAEGKPLKNLTVRVGGSRLDRVSPHQDEAVSGELLITKYGLEGGAIYRLGPTLRRMNEPALTIDFKPQLSADVLRERASNLSAEEWFRCLEVERSSGRVVGEQGRVRLLTCNRFGKRDRAGEEFFSPAARPAADRGSDFIGWRRALE